MQTYECLEKVSIFRGFKDDWTYSLPLEVMDAIQSSSIKQSSVLVLCSDDSHNII